jgi:hypothetical protein
MDTGYRLVLGALAVWRLTHLFYAEDGPFEVLARLRRVGGRLFDCFYCLSVWVAVPIAIVLGDGWVERLLLIPALSGAAILAERATTREAASRALWYEEPSEQKQKEVSDVMLRTEVDNSERPRP